MADRAASKTMLGLLGFSEEAANKIYDVQGVNAISEWKEMDDEAITTLCKVLRRPGGTAAGGGADPGVMVSARAETNLKLAVFFMKHQERVSRGVQWSDVTLSEIRKLSRQREMEDKTSDSGTADTPKVDPKDWSKTMESLVEYLATFRGVTGVPLSYVVRKELIPKTAASDPPTNYNTLDEEMIARAPIMATANASEDGPFVDTFIIDRVKVWEKLSVLMISAEAWTYFKIGRKSKDGRKAFLAVDGHYLGPNNVDHLARSAERKLHNLAYRSERKGWNFEKYVTAHKEQHTILQGLEEHGYKGIDERSKVRSLQTKLPCIFVVYSKNLYLPRIYQNLAKFLAGSASSSIYGEYKFLDTIYGEYTFIRLSITRKCANLVHFTLYLTRYLSISCRSLYKR